MQASSSNRKEQGQALIEFALLATFLILLVMAVLAFGLILTTEVSLLGTANVAAQVASSNELRTEYCSDTGDSDHNNQLIYDTVVHNMGSLSPADIHGIVIFRASADGQIQPGFVDVRLANGDEVNGCYDYNDDGTCDCTCPGGGGCVHDLCVGGDSSGFANEERCPLGTSIGVEIRYRQDVPVPIMSAITGDQIVLPARIIMRIEN